MFIINFTGNTRYIRRAVKYIRILRGAEPKQPAGKQSPFSILGKQIFLQVITRSPYLTITLIPQKGKKIQ
jgi:hypothetical protein